MKRITLLGLALVAACTSTSDSMKSWVGSSDTELMAKWGAPELESRSADGSKILTYYGRNGYGQVLCRQTFTVSPTGTVKAWTHNCPM